MGENLTNYLAQLKDATGEDVISLRLAVQRALCVYLLEEITQANGYRHELDPDNGVKRGKLLFTRGDGPLPQLSILEDADPDRFPRRAGGDTDYPTEATRWALLVQGWVKDDDANPTDPALELMADVTKALAKLRKSGGPYGGDPPSEFRLGGLIAGLTMEPGVARPPMEGASDKAFFWKRIFITLVEDPNDPYKLPI